MADQVLDNMSGIAVSVVYALPEKQDVRKVVVQPGTTAMGAILESQILSDHPELDADELKVGVFASLLDGRSRPLPAQYEVKSGDRLEIYRPLLIDPKQARLQRAKKRRS
ncbi:UPF0125 protein [Pseudohongiella nitratireducens]|uniref:UPF0125 protein GCM10011403_17220 n=1 Tax=Pseudohongiella nitratireducens TaxID=1768907 RepID=A0A916VII0_9GAMM|nr:RnfH family protein [Pseudohongiella nitratireducens]MDF1624085.1 RnfH family protein [Pseudohongiella nitratireducens]GFZ75625.1 UPF0125 protein [Pseudohongiella nitratireducens]|tara:strand:- start:5711 stop:6040 length:330 start_codon:yes stop_codon:yes gene_type:complete